jgi:hypothetical protein
LTIFHPVTPVYRIISQLVVITPGFLTLVITGLQFVVPVNVSMIPPATDRQGTWLTHPMLRVVLAHWATVFASLAERGPVGDVFRSKVLQGAI